jgi:protoporphyrinogen IX oxidase
MGDGYLWIKALHVIAVISWMAGLLYLPRLFVYHTQTEPGSAASERFKVMERLLMKAIMLPAMIVSWGSGLTLIWMGEHLASGGWIHVKLLFVVLLSAVHGFLSKTRKNFVQDQNMRPEKFFRMINEVPTVLMILVVILVVVKPF